MKIYMDWPLTHSKNSISATAMKTGKYFQQKGNLIQHKNIFWIITQCVNSTI